MFLGFSESIAFAVELDDFGAVDEAVDEGDDFEEEVGVAVVVVEVPHLIDRQKLRAGEASQAPGEGCIGVLSGELVEHVRGHGEPGGEAVEYGMMPANRALAVATVSHIDEHLFSRTP